MRGGDYDSGTDAGLFASVGDYGGHGNSHMHNLNLGQLDYYGNSSDDSPET